MIVIKAQFVHLHTANRSIFLGRYNSPVELDKVQHTMGVIKQYSDRVLLNSHYELILLLLDFLKHLSGYLLYFSHIELVVSHVP